MPSDYAKICSDNRRLYGECGAIKYGRATSERLYGDRTHFIYELLQNAEDALERRGRTRNGNRGVAFRLTSDQLRVEHYGDPFTEDDVKAICQFDESTKDDSLTAIGRFGIGFKSVYAYTSVPKIYSGDERFAIHDYIFPVINQENEDVDPNQTTFVMELDVNSLSAYEEIVHALAGLHRRTLLFLENIEEIRWTTDQGGSGQYLRESRIIDEGVCRTTIVSQNATDEDVNQEEWLVFDRSVSRKNDPAGDVRVAFLMDENGRSIIAASDCTLFARFPTTIDTHTGILMDGPYQTTLSRDDVPPRELWNRCLVDKTADLVIESLRYLRESKLLTASVLSCLPLIELGNRSARPLLDPLFERTQQALRSERLLPGSDGGYLSAKNALIPQTSELQKLISSEQLSQLYSGEAAWLDESVINDARVTNYARNYLDIREIRPEEIVKRLSIEFLEDQSDTWIQDLYRFLSPQRALRRDLHSLPIVRLNDGSHVLPQPEGQYRIYLPTDEDTAFRTVRREVCEDSIARTFLEGLGIREWDRIDDLIENVLPKFRPSDPKLTLDEYSADIGRIVEIWHSSNRDMRQRLERALETVTWICAVDTEDRSDVEFCRPSDVYLATDELIALLDGVKGFRTVDRRRECLVGAEVEELMKNCGVPDGLRPVRAHNPDRFTFRELSQMRCRAYPDLQSHDPWDSSLIDWRLDGLEVILASISNASADVVTKKSEMLWNFLMDLEPYYFRGRYEWQYHKRRRCPFDAQFVLTLRSTPWVPGPGGELHRPCDVVFEDLGWRHSDDLVRELQFRSPRLEELASEAGIPFEFIQAAKEKFDAGMTFDEFTHSLGRKQDKSAKRQKRDGESAGHSFGMMLFERQSAVATSASVSAVRLPPGGPRTIESAKADESRAREVHRREGWHVKQAEHAELGPEGKELADAFKDMVVGDYGGRCQVCGRTFAKSDGNHQIFVVHLVSPMDHPSSNHFGNLLGLCGWHFALIQHGQWKLINPETGAPAENYYQQRALILSLQERTDDMDNMYRELPIRFSNVYDEWAAEPSVVDALVHYSTPHWQYLCELLRDSREESG